MTSSPLRHCRRCRLLGLFRTHLHESVVGEPHQQPQPPRNHGQMYFCHPMNFYFFSSLRKQQFLLVHWDVAPGETSAPHAQRQKFQTDEGKSCRESGYEL